MKWFSTAFHDGRRPDVSQDKAIRGYPEHLRALRQAAPEVAELAALNLHDAQVQQ